MAPKRSLRGSGGLAPVDGNTMSSDAQQESGGRTLRARVKVGEPLLGHLDAAEGVGDAVAVGVAIGTWGRSACWIVLGGRWRTEARGRESTVEKRRLTTSGV